MIVCLGEALIDLIPESGESLTTATRLRVEPGGAPYNVAIALKRLDEDVTFIGGLSRDPLSFRLRQLLLDEGIKFAPVELVDNPTRLSLIDPGPPVSFRSFGVEPADTILDTSTVDAALNMGARGLYVSSLMHMHLRSRCIQRHAIETARQLGIPIFADPNPRPTAWADHEAMRSEVNYLMSTASLAKISLDDTSALGWSTNPNEVIQMLSEQTNAQIVVTDGENGSWAQIDSSVQRVSAFDIEFVDATGAGDAFFSVIISGYLRAGRIDRDVLLCANAAGAMTAAAYGAVEPLPTIHSIHDFISTHT